jgi:hypothetical protein
MMIKPKIYLIFFFNLSEHIWFYLLVYFALFNSVSDIINAYAQLDRANYCINVFTATTEYIPADEYQQFVEEYDHTIDFARFMEIIKKLNTSNSISSDDLNFIKQQAKRFDKLPMPNTNIHSLKDYFYQVKNDFEKIR